MNQNLEPVFKIVLPALEKEEIDYWVFGGIGIAAYADKFVRQNGDIDTFVRESDFEEARVILNDICELNDYQLVPHIPAKGRPKLEIEVNGEEKFSVMPVYVENNTVKFVFGRVVNIYPLDVLNRIERNIDGNRFFTPTNEYIKQIFIDHLKDRTDKLTRPKIRIDIEAVFTHEERRLFEFG